MELVRGWEGKFTPDVTGGLRLSKARKYRDIGEEEGLGDTQEGEIRVSMEGKVSSVSEEDAFSASPVSLTLFVLRRDQLVQLAKDVLHELNPTVEDEILDTLREIREEINNRRGYRL